MKLQFVEHAWTVLWHSFSARFNALGLLILGWVQFDPASVLQVWSMMPESVQATLPDSFVRDVGLALVALSLLSRVVKQPKMEATIEAKKNASV